MATPMSSASGRADAGVSSGGRLRRILTAYTSEASLLAGLLILAIVLSITAANFLTGPNLLNIVREASFIGIVAWGMTLVIVAGEIDLSVGQGAAFSSVLLGLLSSRVGLPTPLAVLLVLAIIAAFSMTGGYIRARFNVPSFVTTLALYQIYDGLKQVLSSNTPVPIKDTNFTFWGVGTVFGIPVPILVSFALFALFAVIANWTVFGRMVYSIGGNAPAARLVGIPMIRVRTALFGISGLLGATTGILLTSRLGTATGQMASGLEFTVIAAVVIGGASLSGGRGSMVGTLLGVLLMATIQNGLVLLGVNSELNGTVRGVIILLAVLLNVVSTRDRRTT
jgi:ribose/xylose/arabinose/galactoside ABC-type transport system permease subunit